jgi:hypothetical protein
MEQVMSQPGVSGIQAESESVLSEQVLSAEQVDEFQQRGYLVIDFGFDESLLDRIREKVFPHYPQEHRDNPTLPARVQDAWKQVDEVRQLAVDRRVLKALHQLFGRRPLPFQTLNFPVGTRQLPHSDTIHFNTIPSGYMAGVWVALEDMDEDNGPLIYYPGSHKLPEYNMQALGLGTGYEFYKDYEQAIQKLIAEHGLEPEYGTIRQGEALIWHANLLHGGSPQKDSSRSRHSQVTHYYFEGCRYYTPMHSTGDEIQFRNPVWIPESAEDVPRVLKKIHPGLFKRVLRKLGMQ